MVMGIFHLIRIVLSCLQLYEDDVCICILDSHPLAPGYIACNTFACLSIVAVFICVILLYISILQCQYLMVCLNLLALLLMIVGICHFD